MSISSGIVLDIRNLADLYDDSRYHHTITNYNAIPVRGLHGRGMSFNGTTAYLDCGNDASLKITDVITIEAWINSNLLSGGLRIVDKKDDVDQSPNWGDIWQFYTFNNEVCLNIFNGTSSFSLCRGAITANEWYHLVGVSDGSDMIIYINGVDQGNHISAPSSIVTSNEDLFMGSQRAIAGWFNGTIDNVTIYNYALHPDTIKLHYRQQSPYYQEVAPTICL